MKRGFSDAGKAPFACRIGLGLMIVTGIAALLAAPAELHFISRSEECEREIRFGEAYRAYRARTPFLQPRPPGSLAANSS